MRLRHGRSRTVGVQWTGVRPFTALAAFVVVVFTLSETALAQSQTTPFQLAGEFSSLGLDRVGGDGTPSTGAAGAGLRAEFTLAPHVEIETRVTWFPADLLQEFQAQGGHTLQVAAGIRGKFWASPRFSIYGLLLPGAIHATNAVVAQSGLQVESGGATHFALDTGVGGEWYAGPRWTARVELTGPLYGSPGREIYRSPPGPNGQVFTVSTAARFVNPWQVSTGLGYRFGSPRSSEPAHPVSGRWEVGGDVAHITAIDAFGQSTSFQHFPAVGVFAAYRLLPAVYADGAVHVSRPQVPEVVTPLDGGRLVQALGGAKVGVRRDGYGIFAKIRAGVNHYTGAFASGDTTTGVNVVETRGSNVATIDVGGVFERYVGRRWLIRFDGSDVISIFHPTTFSIDGVIITPRVPRPTDSIQLVVGAGWRF
jgi:hypothetical protein